MKTEVSNYNFPRNPNVMQNNLPLMCKVVCDQSIKDSIELSHGNKAKRKNAGDSLFVTSRRFRSIKAIDIC